MVPVPQCWVPVPLDGKFSKKMEVGAGRYQPLYKKDKVNQQNG